MKPNQLPDVTVIKPNVPALVESAIQYARDVASKRIVAGTYVRKQCKLFLSDLDTRQKHDDFRWRFD
jgi:hypothetical protein